MIGTRALTVAALCAVAIAVAACGDEENAAGEARDLTVVATTTQAADLVRNVAGDRAEVVGLLPANADPHEYEIRPDDVKALADADVVVRSGGDLDDWLEPAIETAGSDPSVLVLIDQVDALEGGHGHEEDDHAEEEGEPHAEEEIDPHWWQDPRNAVKAVAAIQAALSKAEPDATSVFARNADAYTARLTALDSAVAACVDELPAAQRKLVTTHDALGYYARRYGLEVIGAVIPSLSTQAQASAGEVTELVDTIKREQVRAIFAESSVNPKLEQVIADESGAEIGKALWADALGAEGSDGETYLKSIAANTRAIADGLSGGNARCTLPD